MENPSRCRASRTPSSNASNVREQSSQSSGSSSSLRSGTGTPHSDFIDNNSRLSMLKPTSPAIDIPPVPNPFPVSSLGNFARLVGGIRISDGNTAGSEKSDSYSDGYNKFDESEKCWKSGSVPETPMIGSSPYLPSAAKLRSCDVYIGVPSSKLSMSRFVKWLRAELELQGVSCFAVNRSKCEDAVAHNIVDRAMQSATFGVIIVSKRSFANPYSMYELKFFMSRKNLVPIFFDLSPGDCKVRDIVRRRGLLWESCGGELWKSYGGTEKDWKEAVNSLLHMEGWKLEAYSDSWRSCISEAIIILGTKLGRRSVVERVERWMEREREEFPFPRNNRFLGRKKELIELELMLFGDLADMDQSKCFELQNVHGNTREGKRIESDTNAHSKGKETLVWKESDAEIQMESSERLRKHQLPPMGKNDSRRIRRRPTRVRYGKGIACVSGDTGMGKTELVLEFAYRFAQRYRMVLWLGGEERYIRHNYMKLMSIFDIDPSIDDQLCLEKDKRKSFEELEGESIRRLRKEFMRDIPFLIVIDNLESEQDWWDAKSIMELLPQLGGETHIVICTRLSRVMNIDPLNLSYLSSFESMSLMKGTRHNIPIGEVDFLRVIEEKLGRLTFGLAVVGGILSEHPISPQTLLEAIDQMPHKDIISGEDLLSRCNPFLIQLIEFSFLLFDQVDELASRLALASGWFAPSPIPVTLLSLAASGASNTRHESNIWKKILDVVTCRSVMFQKKRLGEDDSFNALVRLGFARVVTKQGYLQFHEIIKQFSRKRGDLGVASAMVQGLTTKGAFPSDCEHIWAACFLLFKFGADPTPLKSNASELVSFVKRLALPLASYTFTNFSRFNAAVELLRVCSNALYDLDESFVSGVDTEKMKSNYGAVSYTPTKEFNPQLYWESATLQATLLEKRAKLMLQGGDLDIGQELCRKCVSIRRVLYGWDHPETVSAWNTLGKLLRSQEYQAINY